MQVNEGRYTEIKKKLKNLLVKNYGSKYKNLKIQKKYENYEIVNG